MKKHLRTHFFAQVIITLNNNRRMERETLTFCSPKGNLFLFNGIYSLKNKNKNLEKW